jgi:preprotein translocase subunit SecF
MATTQEAPVAAKKESFAHRLYTSDFNINFVGRRRLWYIISGVVILICIASLVFRGLNLGVEFKGGTVFTVPTTVTSQTIGDYTNAVNSSSVSNLDGAQLNTQGDNLVRIQVRSLDNEEIRTMVSELAAEAGVTDSEVTYQAVGPSWGGQVTERGIWALVIFLALVALMIGVYFRNWKMSAAALIALGHDLIVTVGVYSLVGFTVTPATITGVLTILGYSLYDTVVVFDKVRENTEDVLDRDVTYSYEANIAVNQVFVRSINTTIVGVLPVIAILVAGIVWLGGQGPLPDLGLAMAVGMVAGAWSSIFIATPLLCQFKENEPEMKEHRAAMARRIQRSKPKVDTSVAEVAEAITPATIVVTTAPIPVQAESAAAGRPQPKKTSRSQRKKS